MSNPNIQNIPSRQETIKEYLDRYIRHWRIKRLDALTLEERILADMCEHYIDAFQSVRATIFGELLPLDKED